jgi:hypothetical protein
VSDVLADHQEQLPLAWYKRRWVLVGVAAVIVALIAVLTDLPQGASRPVQIAGDSSVVEQVNSDVESCAFAAKESFEAYAYVRHESSIRLNPNQVPSLLSQDAVACSFASETIYNLSSIEVPGSPAGKYLQSVVGTVTTWCTADAVLAIESIEKLWTSPSNSSARRQLVRAERELRSDRALVLREMHGADKLLDTHLPAVGIPALPVS